MKIALETSHIQNFIKHFQYTQGQELTRVWEHEIRYKNMFNLLKNNQTDKFHGVILENGGKVNHI